MSGNLRTIGPLEDETCSEGCVSLNILANCCSVNFTCPFSLNNRCLVFKFSPISRVFFVSTNKICSAVHRVSLNVAANFAQSSLGRLSIVYVNRSICTLRNEERMKWFYLGKYLNRRKAKATKSEYKSSFKMEYCNYTVYAYTRDYIYAIF